ncbi:MAG: hypothetical protein O2983_04550 [Planctomycetota bacterium]|nr:hypothetical protein [Planctomycetota bacterium]
MDTELFRLDLQTDRRRRLLRWRRSLRVHRFRPRGDCGFRLAPKVVKGTLQFALCFTLAVAYLSFMAALSVLILGGLLGILWGIGQVATN